MSSAFLPGMRLSSGMGTVYLRRASPGMTTISLTKDLMKGPALGQLALLEEVPHVLGVGCDGVHVVEDLPALGQGSPRLLSGILKPLLPVPVLADAGGEVGHVDGSGLHEVVDRIQSAAHVRQLRLNGPKRLALLPGHAVHLLVHHLHQVSDAALGEDVGANLVDDQLLEMPGVERGSLAGVLAELDVRLADVVGVLAALGEPADERRLAGLALGEAAEQVGASHSSGVADLGCAGAQMPPDAAELGPGDDGGKRLLHPHRFGIVFGVHAPEHCARVRLVGEDVVDAGPSPELPPGTGDALLVEGADDFERPVSGLRHVEHAPDDAGRIRVDLQGGSLLGSVLHHDPVVAEGAWLETQKPLDAASRIPLVTSWAKISVIQSRQKTQVYMGSAASTS